MTMDATQAGLAENTVRAETGAANPAAALDTQKLMQYDANKKSVVVAYLLLFFLGCFGAHRFYLGRTKTAIAMLACSIVGVAASVIIIGFVLMAAVGIWMLVDLFLIPGMARESNTALISRIA